MLKIPQNKEFIVKGFDNIIFRFNNQGVLQGRTEEEFTWHTIKSKINNNILSCLESCQGQYEFRIEI